MRKSGSNRTKEETFHWYDRPSDESWVTTVDHVDPSLKRVGYLRHTKRQKKRLFFLMLHMLEFQGREVERFFFVLP